MDSLIAVPGERCRSLWGERTLLTGTLLPVGASTDAFLGAEYFSAFSVKYILRNAVYKHEEDIVCCSLLSAST